MFTALKFFVYRIGVRERVVHSTVAKAFEHVKNLIFQPLIGDMPLSNPLSFLKEL